MPEAPLDISGDAPEVPLESGAGVAGGAPELLVAAEPFAPEVSEPEEVGGEDNGGGAAPGSDAAPGKGVSGIDCGGRSWANAA